MGIDAKDGKRLLRDALTSLVDTSNDDVLLKSINLDLLMHTRSEEAAVRLVALECAEALWRNHGGKLLGEYMLIMNASIALTSLRRLRLRDRNVRRGDERG